MTRNAYLKARGRCIGGTPKSVTLSEVDERAFAGASRACFKLALTTSRG